MRFRVSSIKGQFEKVFEDKGGVIARAATLAMRETVDAAKTRSRQSIAASGGQLGRRWPNALRSKVFPARGVSLDPAGLIYIRSSYAGVFEEGATITGSPYLWVPLKGTPKTIRRKRMSPGLLRNLVTIRRPGKLPLLGVRVKASEARFGKAITLSLIERGTSAKSGKTRVIPLFIGIPKATIRKRWNIKRAVEQAMDGLPGHYYSNLRDI